MSLPIPSLHFRPSSSRHLFQDHSTWGHEKKVERPFGPMRTLFQSLTSPWAESWPRQEYLMKIAYADVNLIVK
eukprot:scaffold4991_cov156-Ochromonas_danica.AAC.4